MNSSANSLSLLVNIFAAPKQALESLREKYPILLPLILLISFGAALSLFMFTKIDYAWFIDSVIAQGGPEQTQEDMEMARKGMEMMSPLAMGAVSAVSIAIVLPLLFCIYSGYLTIVSKVTNDGFSFKQWFSLTAWCSLPALIGYIASFVTILLEPNGQFALESINPLTFTELLGMNATEGVGKIFATTDLTMLWSIGLMTLGYSLWTKKSIFKALAIIITPYVIYYGIRLLML